MKPDNFVMTDIFTHTTGLAVHVNHTAIHENANDGVTPFDAIDHAVSHHDALKEHLQLKEKECNLLLEDNSKLKSLISGLIFEYEVLLNKSIDRIGSHGTSAISQAKLVVGDQ